MAAIVWYPSGPVVEAFGLPSPALLEAETRKAVCWKRFCWILLDLADVLTNLVRAHLHAAWMKGVEHVHDDVVLCFGDNRRRHVERGLEADFEGVGRRARGVALDIGQHEDQHPGRGGGKTRRGPQHRIE